MGTPNILLSVLYSAVLFLVFATVGVNDSVGFRSYDRKFVVDRVMDEFLEVQHTWDILLLSAFANWADAESEHAFSGHSQGY